MTSEPRSHSRLLTHLREGKRQVVLAYGTSLTEGGQWVNDLRNWLEGAYPGLARVINSGMSGKASNTALAHLEEKVIALNPDTVILEFAINDASSYEEGNMDWGITPELSRKNLHEIMDRILRSHPAAEIILQTMNCAWDAPNGNRSASRRPRLAEYYEGYRQVARERSLLLIDHYLEWVKLAESNRSLFQRYIADGVHPVPEGSTAVTFAGVRKALEA